MASKRWHLTHMDPLSAAKVYALFGLITGLVFGVLSIFASGALTVYLKSSPIANPELMQTAQAAGFWGLIIFLFGGVIAGFVTGYVTAYVYNFVTKLVGGVEFELEEMK